MAKEIDYEDLKQKDIEEKEIKIKIAKGAFKGPIHCQRCKIRMKKAYMDMDIPDGEITIHMEAYKCPKCGRERLSGDQAEKLDYFMAMVDAIKNRTKFKFRRAMNFDGHNWFVRFPNELTSDWKKKVESDIIPLTASDYLVHLHKEGK